MGDIKLNDLYKKKILTIIFHKHLQHFIYIFIYYRRKILKFK